MALANSRNWFPPQSISSTTSLEIASAVPAGYSVLGWDYDWQVESLTDITGGDPEVVTATLLVALQAVPTGHDAIELSPDNMQTSDWIESIPARLQTASVSIIEISGTSYQAYSRGFSEQRAALYAVAAASDFFISVYSYPAALGAGVAISGRGTLYYLPT